MSHQACPGFWGKLHRDPGIPSSFAWHPLEAHCADVGACAEALLQGTLLGSRLAKLAGWTQLLPEESARLALLACIHDLGKFNNGFQDRWDPLVAHRGGHVREILGLFDPAPGFENASARLEELLLSLGILDWCEGGSIERLLIASFAHHGRPVGLGLGAGLGPGIWSETGHRSPFKGIGDLLAQLPQWFPMAFQTGGRAFPDRTWLQHAFSGLVTLADWMGSDERFFPYGPPAWRGRMADSRVLASTAMKELGLDGPRIRSNLPPEPSAFRLVSPHSPSPVQEIMGNLPQAGEGGSLTLLESDTGSGKTEAALADFLHKLREGQVDGLYFALPTRSAATQIYTRVLTAVARAFPAQSSRPPVVLAVPGYLQVDGQVGSRLAGFEVFWPDDPDEATAHRRWAAEQPKRYLVGAVVVGTLDQVLLSTLAVRHSHMRATALLRHLLVVDEVHASDAYMGRLLESVVARHLAAGGHALLMSATLGSVLRSRFFPTGQPGAEPLALARVQAYPAISWRDTAGGVRSWAPGTGRNKEVRLRMEAWMDDPGAIATCALDAAGQGARVVILRNTVADCIATQQALERVATERGKPRLLFQCRGIAAPHHARFVGADRKALDLALDERYGNGCPTGMGCVVVATQTIQQSLDLDADWLITDLCPMDVLLQRMGRLHRHTIAWRPVLWACAETLVLVPRERDLGERIAKGGQARGKHGIGPIYGDMRMLEATWRKLETTAALSIPAMNRTLVEDTTHPEVLEAIVRELGEPWPAHQAYCRGELQGYRSRASLNLARWEVPFGDPESLFPDGELAMDIRTRLGEGDRLVGVGQKMSTPFGHAVQEMKIPAFMVQGLDGGPEASWVKPFAGGFEFGWGGATFRYDRYGLQKVPHPIGDGIAEEEADG